MLQTLTQPPKPLKISGDLTTMTSAASNSSPFPRQTRRIPDDTVSYSIYPDDPSSLHSLHLQILTSILPSFIPSTYIWQHEPFNLTPVASPIPHLRGSVRFGDNLDDEWLITALLFRISALVPSLSISVLDSDGDFLLIESAFHLPRWLRPDNSAHRIFIRNNLLHIIPKDLDPLTLQSSLNTLKSAKIDTLASDPIQSAIKNKISAYPERALANMHRARVRVPVAVAQVLKQEPCLVSLAVEGFYDRDIDSMKHAMKMERFLKEGEMVRTAVTMTRVMYGQLVQQSFQAPRCYPMPGRNEVGSEGFKEAEIGMKIACGLEMMYQERRKEGEEGKGGTWEVFLKSLEGAGFFEGLLPGSQEYKKKMEGAMEYYKNSTLASRTRYYLFFPFLLL